MAKVFIFTIYNFLTSFVSHFQMIHNVWIALLVTTVHMVQKWNPAFPQYLAILELTTQMKELDIL